MKTKGWKTMTSQLKHIVAIKLNEREFYPRSLSEWLGVYFYSVDLAIKKFAIQEMKAYNQQVDSEIWEKLYFSTSDEDIRHLAFEILPSKKGFNKKFISCKNSLTSFGEGVKTIIPRASLLHYIRMLREMLKHYETLDELMFILSSAREMEKRVNIFNDLDLKSEIHQIYIITKDEVLKYIASCDCDLSNDFASKSKDEDKKLCLLDLNHICREFSKVYWGDGVKIFEIIEKNLNRDFDSYIKLYQNGHLDHEISKIILLKIKSSKPTLEELVKVFESTKNSDSETLRDYSLKEIIERFKNVECAEVHIDKKD